MFRKSWAVGLGVTVAVLGGACSSTTQEKSTGTNWIHCKADADCAADPTLRCGAEGVCVPRSAGTGGQASFEGGLQQQGGSGQVGGYGGFPGGAPNVAGGGGLGGTGSGGYDNVAGGGSTGTGGQPPVTNVCFSPGQQGSSSDVGCRCTESLTPNGVCVGLGNPFLCQNAHWQYGSNSACGCWTPDQPEFANRAPDNGCACVNENETKCIVSQGDGEKSAVCRGGTWKLDAAPTTCTCTTDAQCGFGGKCIRDTDAGPVPGCVHRQCEVDGVRYAVGVEGIPDPSDECNTCKCEANGDLTCTLISCNATVCPPNTVQTSTCVGCGLAGGCALTRHGCLPMCSSDADCVGTGTPVCDTTKHVCGAGPCD